MTVDYAKAAPTDMCIRITVENRGPEAATLHVLPTLWFRNTWAWGLPGWDEVPRIQVYDEGTLSRSTGPWAGWCWPARTVPSRCAATTSPTRSGCGVWRTARPYPKDGINDYLVHGAPTVNPDRMAPRAPCTTQWTCRPGARGRSGCASPTSPTPADEWSPEAAARSHAKLDLAAGFDAVVATRQREADEFFADVTPAGASADEAAGAPAGGGRV